MGTLSSFVCVLGLSALLARTSSASSDVFDSVLGNTASCHKSCEMTYSLHTYPRVSGASSKLKLQAASVNRHLAKLAKQKNGPFVFPSVFCCFCLISLWLVCEFKVCRVIV